MPKFPKLVRYSNKVKKKKKSVFFRQNEPLFILYVNMSKVFNYSKIWFLCFQNGVT